MSAWEVGGGEAMGAGRCHMALLMLCSPSLGGPDEPDCRGAGTATPAHVGAGSEGSKIL